MKISNSISGFFYYSLVGFIFYFVCLKLGVASLGTKAITLDAVFLGCAMFSLLCAGMFMIAHFALRKFQNITRSIYSLISAVIFALVMWGLTSQSLWGDLVAQGLVVLTTAPVLLVGAMAGFLYHWCAGIDYEEEDINQLQEIVDQKNGDVGDQAHVTSDSAEYYDGPLQVKTSIGALFIASLFGLLVFDVFNFAKAFLPDFFAMVGTKNATAGGLDQLEILTNNLNYGLVTGLFTKVIFILPYGLVILACHLTVRGIGYFSYQSYLIASLVVPFVLMVFSLVIPGATAFVGFNILVPMVIGVMIYRSLAGLEPKSLPEDVVVSDRRTLISKEHAGRRYRKVIPKS